MAQRVGWIGLGTMGGPMAGHVLRSGVALTVWNRTVSKTEALRELGADVAEDPRALAERCDTVILCINRTEDVAAQIEAMGDALRPGALVIDHSTISPVGAQAIAESLAVRGIEFVDAPVTGGSMGAQNGTLTVFLGGTEAACERARPIIRPYSARAERVGPSGAGQRMKVANQIAVGGALLALCESFAFAQKAGLDLAQTRALVGSGAGGSWAIEHYGKKILGEDWSPGFSIKNQRKDFGYCAEAAAAVDASLPGTRLVDALLAAQEAEGLGESTTARLFEYLLSRGFAD
ncbi:MAG: NAD(P)-dependent oxidoreductase [Fimbriimonadaceae bacterium]|nr:NAD(P)-dependent oxidoreductase [Fimbriimonadaceae bacterium]